MKPAAIQAANLLLSKCGRTVPPTGYHVTDINVGFFYQTVIGTAATQQQPLEIVGDTPFVLSSISGIQPPAGLDVYLQILFPTGRTLQQALRDWTQDAGAGSSRYVLDREVECPPGSKIKITGSTAFASPQTTCAFSVLFEGCYRFYLAKGTGADQPACSAEVASSLPRIFNTRNQNIAAPRWMTGLFPSGWQKYIYATAQQSFALPAAAAGVNSFIELVTDTGFDFQMMRRIIRYSVDVGSSATPYIRSRLSDGTLLDDDYVSVPGVTGMFLGKNWEVPAGKSIITDISVVDNSGTGNLNIQFFYEGTRKALRG